MISCFLSLAEKKVDENQWNYHFLMRPRISIRGCVCPSVGPSVRPSVQNQFAKINKNGWKSMKLARTHWSELWRHKILSKIYLYCLETFATILPTTIFPNFIVLALNHSNVHNATESNIILPSIQYYYFPLTIWTANPITFLYKSLIIFKSPFWLKLNSQCWHLNGFSPVWILCFF